MNEMDILRAFDGADERYIAEYESFRPTRKIRVNRRLKFGAAIAAAVALLTVPAGAYVYNLAHKAEVESYLTGDSADYIEQNGLALNCVSENEHIRLTVDALLSDGHIGEVFMTLEGLDAAGTEAMRDMPFPEIYLADGSTEDIITWGGLRTDIVRGGQIYTETRTDTQYTALAEICLDEIDTGKSYLMKFGLDKDPEKGLDHVYDEDGEIIGNVMEGISVEISFAPNVECVELQGENGETVWLSQIGISSRDEDFVYVKSCNKDIMLVKNGGLIKEKAKLAAGHSERDPGIVPIYCGWFKQITDVDDYAGVEVGGIKYLKTE